MMGWGGEEEAVDDEVGEVADSVEMLRGEGEREDREED